MQGRSGGVVGLAFVCLWGAVLILARGRGRIEARARELGAENARLAERLAEGAASVSDPALEGARRALYLAQLSAARDAFAAGRLADATQRLEGVPEEHRGFAWRYLDHSVTAAVRELPPAEDEVAVLALSFDGARLATGAIDGSAFVFDADSLELVAELLGTGEEVTALALDETGATLAVGERSGALTVWDVSAEEVVFEWEGERALLSLACTPDAEWFVAGFEDGAACVWHPPEALQPIWLEESDTDVLVVAIAPDGSGVAIGGEDGTVRVHAGDGFGKTTEIDAHSDWLRSLAFVSASLVMSGSDDGTLGLWSPTRGTLHQRLEPGRGPVIQVGMPGGVTTFVTAHGAVRFRSRYGLFAGVDLPVSELGLVTAAVSDAERGRVFYAIGDERARVWQRTPRETHNVRLAGTGDVSALATSAEGDLVAAADYEGIVRLLNRATGEPPTVLEGHRGAVLAMAFTPDGATLVSGDVAGAVHVWDVATLEARLRFEAGARVVSVAIRDDGARVLAVGHDGSAHLWNGSTGELLRASPAPGTFVFGAVAAPSAERYVWVADSGTIRAWDPETGERVAALRDRRLGLVSDFCLSPDGERLALVSNGNRALVYDLATGSELGRTASLARSLATLAFDSTGERLAAAALQGGVEVWDIRSGTRLLNLATEAPAQVLAFGPDGRSLFAGSSAARLFEWSVPE